ncbi:hypothetical protein BGW38_003219 [Lunasporangiospora selenospora]|uniref:Uncharacterized protein n=1 Tax=Lunasporangiospora selenospora TaxID=979761 RepID=A0A9P6FRR1_9FUNG|nr:hypothetical protein BGW38_003219 [Lunasporangiospora selenospora]
MKFTTAFAAIAAVAAIATLNVDAAPTNAPTPSTLWCKSFSDACKAEALKECTVNNVSSSNCNSGFFGETCDSFTVKCVCTPAGGSPKDITKQALQTTFANTGGKCSELTLNPNPPNPLNPSGGSSTTATPSATSATASATGSATASGSSTAATSTSTNNTPNGDKKSGASTSQVAVLSTVALSAAVSLVLNVL